MTPKVLISYAWDTDTHNQWVEDLAKRLRADGIETILDQWHLALGASLTQFMESAVRDNDFAINICTPAYKSKADARAGGVGYESDLMTAERLVYQKRAKFLPILREGNWANSMPTWLTGIAGLDFTGSQYSERNYNRLVAHLHGRQAAPPPVGSPPSVLPITSYGGTVSATQQIINNAPISNQVNMHSGTVNLTLPSEPDQKG